MIDFKTKHMKNLWIFSTNPIIKILETTAITSVVKSLIMLILVMFLMLKWPEEAT